MVSRQVRAAEREVGSGDLEFGARMVDEGGCQQHSYGASPSRCSERWPARGGGCKSGAPLQQVQEQLAKRNVLRERSACTFGM